MIPTFFARVMINMYNFKQRFRINKQLGFSMKMQFISDENKQAQELYFSKKAGNQKLLDLIINKNNMASYPSVKHLGMLLDSLLNLQSTYRVTGNNATR